jgi:SAM-dependent methyltransferase
VPTLEETRALVRERSPLSEAETEAVLRKRFETLPRRLEFALERWPLERSRVLDVGCSYGHCLVHFGEGSVGIDSNAEQVDFCRSLGLDARLADANRGVDVPDGAFDYAWVSDVIEHLDAPRLLLRSIAPKLKPDGRLLVFLTVLPHSRALRAALRWRGYHGFDAEAHHYQFTYDTAAYLVERAGYALVEAHAPFRLPPRVSPRLYLEARPDPRAEELAQRAEARNRSGG